MAFAIAQVAAMHNCSLTVIHPDISDMSQTKLFEPFKLGPITLSNRLVMAPLTRNRAEPSSFVPSPLAIEYYGQRASAGLLITEASQVSQQGQGYQDTPGIYSKEQVAAGARSPTASTKRAGGSTSSSGMSAASRTTRCSPVAASRSAPSAIRAKGKTFVNGTFTEISEPRALELSEIPGIIDDFKRAAENALAAGFDGVEIHGANGYLLDQFAKDGTNKRTDAYGGSIENRAKLMLEVSKAVAAVAGAERTGIRISPVTPANDVSDTNPQPLFDHIVDRPERAEADLHPRHRRRHRRPARHRAVRLRQPAQALQAGLHGQQRL